MAGLGLDVFILKDEDGEYYEIPRDTIEAARVAGARKAELDELLKEPEVQGHQSGNNPVVTTLYMIPIAGQAALYAHFVANKATGR